MIVSSDLSALIPPEVAALLTEEIVTVLLADIAEAARAEWIRIAQGELATSKRDYLAGIQPVATKPGVAVVSLVGQVPNIVEQGQNAYDMHDTLLGPNVPVAPDGEFGKHLRRDGGFYRAVPFRHGTPTSGGAAGQPMGRAYRGHELVPDAEKLGRDVYAAAKKLSATTSDPYQGASYGGRLPEGLAPLLKSHHAVDIYAGMVRERKTYLSATQSQYTTFRTISTGSPGWIRPATPGRKFAERVAEHVAKIAPQTFEAYVRGIQP